MFRTWYVFSNKSKAMLTFVGRIGCTMVVPFRGDEMEVRHIKVMGDLGNVAPVPFNARDRESIREAVQGSDVVINLIGKHYETKHFFPWWINYSYDDVHVDIARAIGEVCLEAGVPRLIHHSSIAAKPNSQSMWASSKYRGEIAIRKAFPDVNIVRSATIYGPEDRFLNWYAERMIMGGVPLINGGDARVQPVFVNDVAKAILAVSLDKSIAGKTFDLVGDDEYTHKEIAEYVFDVTKHEPRMINLPLGLAEVCGKVSEKFPDPMFTADQAIMSTIDQVKSSNLPGLRELDIEPSNMEREAFSFLLKYNRGGHFQEVSGYH